MNTKIIIAFLILFLPISLWAASGGLDFDQIQDISTGKILGRNTAGSGDIEELASSTVATILDSLQAGNNLSDLSATSTAIGNLGLTLGADTQAFDAGLLSIAGLNEGANAFLYTTDTNVYATNSISAVSRVLLGNAATSTWVGDFGLTIGADVQAWDAELDTIAGLTETNGNVMFVAGGAWTSDATPAIDCTDCTNITATAASTTLDVIENSGADSTIEIKAWDWTIDSTGASSTFAIDGGTGVVTIADLSLTATTSLMADLGLTIGTDTQAWDTVLDELASTTATKGDIFTSDGTDFLEFPVGANSFVLTASSSASNGLVWQSGGTIPLSRISGSTFSTIQDMQNLNHSPGWISGGGFTDDTDGTVTIAAGTGFIRATDSATVELLFTDWSAESGANVNLVDAASNWIYVEYNAGSPQVRASTTKPTDLNTNFIIGVVARDGTTLHINTADKYTVGNHPANMVTRLQETLSWAQVSGGIIGETGTRNISLTEGDFWRGLTEFTTSAFNSSGADTFTYFHRDGSGGFTSQVGTSAIDNLGYDSGAATSTLSNNKYGVHWVYLEVDDDVVVLYGVGDYTLSQAEDAQPPASVPPQIETHGFLVGKIIVEKSDATFTQIESAFQTTFQGSLAQDHGGLAGLSDDDHTQYVLADATRDVTGTLTVDGLTMGANELLTIGSKTLTHDATTFLFNDSLKLNGASSTIYMLEQAEADPDFAGYGQLWVNTATPTELYFTTDTGVDFNLSDALLASNNLSDLAATSTAIGNLGLTIGADTQSWDADLDTIAGLSAGTSTLMISSSTAWSTFEVSLCSDGNVLTASSSAAVGLDCLAAGAGDLLAANNLSDLSATSTAIGNLGLTLGTDTQAWDADLDEFAALDQTSGNLIAASSSVWVVVPTGSVGDSLVASATASGYDFLTITGGAAAASTTLDVIEDVGADFTTEFKLWDWTIDSAGASSTLVIDGGAGTVTIAGLSLSGSGTVIADLGLTIGADLQAWDDDLDDLAGLTPTKGDIIATAGTNWTDFAVGTNGKVLVASSSAANGLDWSNVTTITEVGTIVAGVWNGTAIAAGFYAAGSIDGDDLNSNIAGGYLTLTAASPDTLDLDAEVVERTIIADWNADGFQASSTVFIDINNAMLIQEAGCYGSDGGSGEVTIEMRSSVTPTTASSTNILSAKLVSAGGTVASTTSFANDTADADTVLAFIMGVASSSAAYPDFHRCYIHVKVVD